MSPSCRCGPQTSRYTACQYFLCQVLLPSHRPPYTTGCAPAGWGAPWCYHGDAKNTPDADSACRKRRLKEQKVWGSRNEPRELKSDMLGEKRPLTDHSMTQKTQNMTLQTKITSYGVRCNTSLKTRPGRGNAEH